MIHLSLDDCSEILALLLKTANTAHLSHVLLTVGTFKARFRRHALERLSAVMRETESRPWAASSGNSHTRDTIEDFSKAKQFIAS